MGDDSFAIPKFQNGWLTDVVRMVQDMNSYVHVQENEMAWV